MKACGKAGQQRLCVRITINLQSWVAGLGNACNLMRLQLDSCTLYAPADWAII